jgi:hypothetical protein
MTITDALHKVIPLSSFLHKGVAVVLQLAQHTDDRMGMRLVSVARC